MPLLLRKARSCPMSRKASVSARPVWTGRPLQHCRQRGRRQAPIQRSAGPGQGASAHRVHAIAERQRQQRQRRQHDQRLHAAAGEDAVEHLHHIDGRHQQRQVEQQARRAGQQHERPEVLDEQPTHDPTPPQVRAGWMLSPSSWRRRSVFGRRKACPGPGPAMSEVRTVIVRPLISSAGMLRQKRECSVRGAVKRA